MTDQQIIQKLAAVEQAVAALTQSIGTRLTREQLARRRGIHRNTLAHLIERGVVPRPDVSGRFELCEVLEFESMERQKRATA